MKRDDDHTFDVPNEVVSFIDGCLILCPDAIERAIPVARRKMKNVINNRSILEYIC